MRKTLDEAYDRLFAAYGPQHWWPGESAFEMMVGAMLVQNTAWTGVTRAIAAIRRAGLMGPKKLFALDEQSLQELIRPVGYFRVKEKRLRNLLRMIVEDFGGSHKRLLALPADELRETLLAVNGVGKETADSIVLYAANHPRFVIDAYTGRVLERHGWIDEKASYDEMQALFEQNQPVDVARYNEYHALIVMVGKTHCGPKPKCEGCPLAPMLPK